ncbi:DUF262 domain-containing protein [uncultured Tateyamaria sp.]|uniref:GmrSD restriction endonuclease domain-containing protein n=1 Tax=uncultured Tateyamaria sp. TaxID=455651 RepID=UPI00260B3209|nr:DUF262 domain-containing protein [uncultured Tateyamaria sp.]
MSKKTLPIATICAWMPRIDPTPDYQRPPAWSRKQKQLLIDSILREYDIPKMYWRSVDRDDGVKYEVIDGQQRLRTIWEFRDGKYALPRDTDPIQGIECSGKKYDDLDMDISTVFDSYAVDVVIIDDAIQTDEEDEVRDMFLRLQNGTTLKAQEKRNAMPGQMRNFAREIAAHPFFENCKFNNSRFTFDHVASQMICIEIAGGPTSVRDSDLNRMYRSNTAFDANGKHGKKVRRVLDYLLRAFPEKTPELERYNAISLYCLASTLLEGYVHLGTENHLASWFIDFETSRRANDHLDEEERDASLIEYKRMTSYSTDAEESIRGRLEFLEKLFFSKFPDIEPRDTIRTFTPEQRLAIFRRGGGVCQIVTHCDGGKLSWGEWHADHITPHTKGGKTVVSNGQIACPACNLSKGSG